MMLMIIVLWTRQRQHVNKATGELAWKHGVQRSLDARRGQDVEERRRDKTDDCCLFVVAVFPLSNSSLYPFTPCRYPFLPSLYFLTTFFPPCSPSLSYRPVCVCVSIYSVIKIELWFQGRVMGAILGCSVRSSSHWVPLPKSQVPVWTSLYTNFSLSFSLSLLLARSLTRFFCTIWYQRHDN